MTHSQTCKARHNYCVECRIEFEPKTPKVECGDYVYHVGCFEAMKQRGIVVGWE